MEFAEVPMYQFVPPMNFSLVETEIIDAEISKLLSEGVIANNEWMNEILHFTLVKNLHS